MRRIVQRLAVLTVAALSLCALACDGSQARRTETGATLEGTVKYGDQPIMVAMVIAQGPGGAATAFIGDDGRYKLDNVPLGEVNIAVNTDAGKGNLMSKVMAQSKGGPKTLPRVIEVPKKYFDPTQSGIKTTVVKGANTYDIVLPK
jgi:hypothetical protein